MGILPEQGYVWFQAAVVMKVSLGPIDQPQKQNCDFETKIKLANRRLKNML